MSDGINGGHSGEKLNIVEATEDAVTAGSLIGSICGESEPNGEAEAPSRPVKRRSLLEQLQAEHRRLGERLNSTERQIRKVHLAINRVKSDPQLGEDFMALIEALGRY